MLSRFRMWVLLSCGLLAGGIFFTLCTRPIRIPDQPETIPVPPATADVHRAILSVEPWVEVQSWQVPGDPGLYAAGPAGYNGLWITITVTQSYEKSE